MFNEELLKIYKDMTDEINELADRTIEMAKSTLESKYGCEMQVKKIGNRINTESTTLYFCPLSSPEIVFTAIVDAGMNEVKDNYIIKLVAEQIKHKSEEIFSASLINTECNVFVYGENPDYEDNTDITAEEYIALYSVNSIFIYMAVDANSIDNTASDRLIKATKAICDEYGKTVAVSGFVIGENFDKCKAELDVNPDVSDTWFYGYDVVSSFKFAVVDGVCNLSENELSSKIQR